MEILVFDQYTQKEWNHLHVSARLRVTHEYNMQQWREQWRAQHVLEAGMGIPGDQLQPYRA